MSEWRAILCAVDFSPPSHAALLEAARLARKVAGLLTVVHVAPAPRPGVTPFAPPSAPARAEPGAAATLDAWAREVEAAAGAPVSTALLAGRPADAIVAAAVEGGFDAIVVGTHGRTGLAHAVLGSVAEHVVRRSTVPVVAVPHR